MSPLSILLFISPVTVNSKPSFHLTFYDHVWRGISKNLESRHLRPGKQIRSQENLSIMSLNPTWQGEITFGHWNSAISQKLSVQNAALNLWRERQKRDRMQALNFWAARIFQVVVILQVRYLNSRRSQIQWLGFGIGEKTQEFETQPGIAGV